MHTQFERRELLALTGLAVGAAATSALSRTEAAAEPAKAAVEPFTYCLNTSTIQGQELGLVEKIEIAARAGYQGIEPWIREIDQYIQAGGSLSDLRKRIAELGLTVESAIGFAEWIVDDDAQRALGLEEARRAMDLVQQIGGTRLAAPPAGAREQAGMDLLQVAERYRALLELGERLGVVPQLEVWGFSRTLSRLGEAALVAIESQHPRACLLLDVYHLYKGGSDYTGLALLAGASMHVMHVNDYPASPTRADITDAHRVYPGDGSAPLDLVFRSLRAIGFRGALSLELFNRDYWKQDPFIVARTGLEKLKTQVAKAVGKGDG